MWNVRLLIRRDDIIIIVVFVVVITIVLYVAKHLTMIRSLRVECFRFQTNLVQKNKKKDIRHRVNMNVNSVCSEQV